MIGSSENRISYNGNGIATEFAYTFKILEKSDIKVLHVAADGTETLLTKDYYVDMDKSVVLYPGYAPGAEIPEAQRPPILPEGERIILYREVPITQESQLDKHWPFNVIESGLDKLTIICQQIFDKANRSLSASESVSKEFNFKVPIQAGKSFRISDDGLSFEVTEDPARAITICEGYKSEAVKSASTATTFGNEAIRQAAAAAESEANAKQSMQNAQSALEDAIKSANAASASEANANASMLAAQEALTSTQVSASEAAASEANAKESMLNAQQALSNAINSASAAANSEANAKTSEQNAQTILEQAQASASAAAESEANADSSEAGAQQALEDAKRVVEGVGNPVSSVVTSNGKVVVTKSNGDTNEFPHIQTVNGISPDNKGNVEIAGVPVGFEYFSTNPNIPAGSLPLLGGEYSRKVYSDLWAWVQEQAGYLIEESEWQEKSAANEGNVPFYSKGNGSTTFRVPSLKCWVKGANGIEEVGSYLSAGLPNITTTEIDNFYGEAKSVTGALSFTSNPTHTYTNSGNGKMYAMNLAFDASRCSSIYGNSDTVQPKSIVGIWLVKAYGTVTNVGSTDVANIASGLTEAETRISELEEIRGSGAGYHNSIYRGKYLGSSVTAAQWAAIKAGTFDDLYLGDYWTINGVDWVIMAFDYYLNCGDTATTAHHIVIVPSTLLYSAKMNTSNTTDGGYVGSAMYTTNLNTAKTTIANAFGSGHILTIRQLFVNNVANGYSSNGTLTDATVWLMNEINVYGGKIFGDFTHGTNWAYLNTIDNAQYPAFMFNPSLIKTSQTYWLRDVASPTAFALVDSYGYCSNYYASNSDGVRPAFCIYKS